MADRFNRMARAAYRGASAPGMLGLLAASCGLMACQGGDVGSAYSPMEAPGSVRPGSVRPDDMPFSDGQAGQGTTQPPPGIAASTPPAPNVATTGTPPIVPACRDTSQRAREILTEHCSGCHGDSAEAQGGFSTILDVPALVDSGKLVEYEPEASIVFQRIASGMMPPASVDKRPRSDEIDALELWIACGAPDWTTSFQSSSFVTIDWRLSTVLADLRSLPNPTDRERVRYLDFSHLRNAGHSPDQLDIYRQATWFVLNSLSRGRTALVPQAVDESRLIYRIDLRDYLWDEDSWERIEQEYLYAAVYDPDSRLFPVDEDSAEQIREETGTTIPVMQADWFISHASRPPLYFALLDLPATFAELERQLDIDTENNAVTEQVLRSGFLDSVPSRNNRMVERHSLGGGRGALWRAYDFASNLDFRNIFAHPLDFQEDGGSVLFSLPNGLQAYYVMNAAGERLDKAPTDVVRDPAARDGAVEPGISCMNCHQLEGVLPKYDEVRDFQLNAGPSVQVVERVLALYASPEQLTDAFDADNARYQEALAALGITGLTTTSMHELDATHQGLLDLETVGAVVGITADELKRAIDASPQAFPREIVTLRGSGGSIQRDAFDTIVGELVEALGLGRQLRSEGQGRAADDAQGADAVDDEAVIEVAGDAPGPEDEQAEGEEGEEGEEAEPNGELGGERLQCQNAGACDEVCGVGCTVTCRDVNNCAPQVGPGGEVDCERVGSCNPTCTGACRVLCANVGSCNPTCSVGPAVDCGNGIRVCGQACPG